MEILISEDDLISRTLLEKMVAEMGHQVIVTENGHQAWESIRQRPIRMVITDWVMPEMDGLGLCRKIRGAKMDRYVYIIMLTSRDGQSDLVEVFESGADDYITKPFNPDELRARLLTGLRVIELEEGHRRMKSEILHNAAQIEAKNKRLETTLKRLEETQAQMVHSEKMASIGQLAAGVAHEINNPTGFVSSNLKTLADYQKDIATLIAKYRELIGMLSSHVAGESPGSALEEVITAIKAFEKEIELDYVLSDITDLINDCREGTNRIKKIVLDLKDFAHPGEDRLQATDINHGLDSTLNVVSNELKYKATVVTDYGDLPMVQGYPQQLNQVFMNILVNAAQAIEKKGRIEVRTRAVDRFVEVTIQDNGCGVPPGNLSKIFDPFFTTKEVGKGTGLGMNIAYNIVRKHNGTIEVTSDPGQGTTFTIRLPATA
ncbi:MAG: response regulator [Desulfatitalea sp.]|nr:response regulator [Desulfatitalea sp.]